MTQETIQFKILSEIKLRSIQIETPVTTDHYIPLRIFEQYVNMIYGAGFDAGKQFEINRTCSGIAVAQIDINGNEFKYPSISIAAKDKKVSRTSLTKAIKRNGKCAGYYWKFTEKQSPDV